MIKHVRTLLLAAVMLAPIGLNIVHAADADTSTATTPSTDKAPHKWGDKMHHHKGKDAADKRADRTEKRADRADKRAERAEHRMEHHNALVALK